MTRTRSRAVGAALAAVVLLVAACSDDDDGSSSSDTSSSTTTEASSSDSSSSSEDGGSSTTATGTEGAGLATSDSALGTILVDAQGNTLYLFTQDTQAEPSTCTGGCAAAWPAFTGPVTAGDGVDESLLGTVTDDDGAEQVTYDGWPLYYYAEDRGPGDTNGQGENGVWWVIAPDGTPIES